MNSICKILELLQPDERRKGLNVLLLVFGLALLETLGVASVMPFLAVLSNPDVVFENTYLFWFYKLSATFGVVTVDSYQMMLGFLAFLSIVVSAIYRIATFYTLNNFIEFRRHSISTRLLEGYLNQPYTFFLHRRSSEMSKTILSEVDELVSGVLRPTFNMFAFGLVVIVMMTTLLAINPFIASIAIGLIGGLYGVAYFGLRRFLYRLGVLRISSNSGRFAAAAEALEGVKIIKLLGCESSYLQRFEKPSMQFASAYAKHHLVGQIPKYVVEAVAIGAIILLVLVVMVSGEAGPQDRLSEIVPLLGLYVLAAYRLQPAMKMVFSGISSLRYGKSVVDQIHQDLTSEKTEIQSKLKISKKGSIKKTIHFDNIEFQYQERVERTLCDISLTIKIGTMIGIVGRSGAGKTTLVDVLLGLLTPSGGTIRIDGARVDSMVSFQQCFGYVPQDVFLTDATLAENIAMGIPTEEIDHGQIERCVRLAQLEEFVTNELPEKYQTKLGERGVRVSGGQRQRIGIARALYHDPAIVVFDEATSALDAKTEKLILESLVALAALKTIVIIAHRLNMIQHCDQVIFLHDGRVAASGPFSKVSQESKKFRDLATLVD